MSTGFRKKTTLTTQVCVTDPAVAWSPRPARHLPKDPPRSPGSPCRAWWHRVAQPSAQAARRARKRLQETPKQGGPMGARPASFAQSLRVDGDLEGGRGVLDVLEVAAH